MISRREGESASRVAWLRLLQLKGDYTMRFTHGIIAIALIVFGSPAALANGNNDGSPPDQLAI